MLKVFKSKGHCQGHMLKWIVLSEGLVIRNTHAKYEGPIFLDKKVTFWPKLQQSVDTKTDGQTDRQTDGQTEWLL